MISTTLKPCASCDGTGRVVWSEAQIGVPGGAQYGDCPDCDGSGEVPDSEGQAASHLGVRGEPGPEPGNPRADHMSAVEELRQRVAALEAAGEALVTALVALSGAIPPPEGSQWIRTPVTDAQAGALDALAGWTKLRDGVGPGLGSAPAERA